MRLDDAARGITSRAELRSQPEGLVALRLAGRGLGAGNGFGVGVGPQRVGCGPLGIQRSSSGEGLGSRGDGRHHKPSHGADPVAGRRAMIAAA